MARLRSVRAIGRVATIVVAAVALDAAPRAQDRRDAAPREALPDLTIHEALPVRGTAARLRVRLANVGRRASPSTQLTLFYRRDERVTRHVSDVPQIGAGQSIWIDVEVPGALGDAAAITLRVDDPPRVDESDELNNGFTVK